MTSVCWLSCHLPTLKLKQGFWRGPQMNIAPKPRVLLLASAAHSCFSSSYFSFNFHLPCLLLVTFHGEDLLSSKLVFRSSWCSKQMLPEMAPALDSPLPCCTSVFVKAQEFFIEMFILQIPSLIRSCQTQKQMSRQHLAGLLPSLFFLHLGLSFRCSSVMRQKHLNTWTEVKRCCGGEEVSSYTSVA